MARCGLPRWCGTRNNVEHVARHRVTVNEVEEVVFPGDTRWVVDDSRRPGRLAGRGLTCSDDPWRSSATPLPRQGRLLADRPAHDWPRLREEYHMTCSAKRDAVVEAEDFERELYQRDATQADEREYLSVGTPVGVRVGPHPMSALTVRFDAEVIDVLRERAGAEGVGVTQLVRAWVMERLAAPDEEGLPVEATLRRWRLSTLGSAGRFSAGGDTGRGRGYEPSADGLLRMPYRHQHGRKLAKPGAPARRGPEFAAGHERLAAAA